MTRIADGLSALRSGQNGARSYSSGNMPKMLVVQICQDELFRTAGDDDPTLSTLYDIPELRQIGTMMKGVRVH